MRFQNRIKGRPDDGVGIEPAVQGKPDKNELFRDYSSPSIVEGIIASIFFEE